MTAARTIKCLHIGFTLALILTPPTQLRSLSLEGIRHAKASSRYRAVKGTTVHVEKRGHIFAALPFVDQLPCVVDLLPGKFRLAPEFHTSAFRVLHSGACPFAYQATFQFREYADHLPHGTARG